MNEFLLFVGEEWVFIFSIAGFIIALLGLLLTVVNLKEHNKIKIIVVTILSIVTLVCAISVFCHILIKPNTSNTSEIENEEEPSSDSKSSDEFSTNTSSSNSDSTTPTILNLYAEKSAETEKWGYVDDNGNVIIPYIYDAADDFIDGYAAVALNNYKWGFIDKSGNEMIAFEFNGAWSFIDGLAPVFDGDKWGFIDENGILKIPFKFKSISRNVGSGKRLYMDENNNFIDYEKEMSSTSSSNPSSPVPVGNIIHSYVSAYINNSFITITVSKNLPDSMNNNSIQMFTWGLDLKDNLNEDDQPGEYVIEIILSIDGNGKIIKTDSNVMRAREGGGKEIVKEHPINVDADFDGENYVVTCDIANDYIDFDKICVNRNFYC